MSRALPPWDRSRLTEIYLCHAVSRALPPWDRSRLTEIYRCRAWSSHESEDGNARADAGIRRLHSAKAKGAAGLGYELGAQLPATAPLAGKGSRALTERWVPLRLGASRWAHLPAQPTSFRTGDAAPSADMKKGKGYTGETVLPNSHAKEPVIAPRMRYNSHYYGLSFA